MPLLLSILALVAAAVAVLVAWRASRAAHRLALEMVHLRDRLAAAEAQYEQSAEVAQRAVEAARRGDPALSKRLQALEARLRSDAAPEKAPVDVSVPQPDPRDAIRRGLQREGYTHVSILRAAGDDEWLVEAERDGITGKGRVRVRAGGGIDWQPVSTVRAFP